MNRQSPLREKRLIVDRKPILARIEAGPNGQFLRANAAIANGQQIFFLDGKIVPVASKHTIQLDNDRHVATQASIWRFINHACVPNMKVDTHTRAMVAIRNIAEDEELNFNYNTSEWSISSPFTCGCGLSECIGEVRGFKFLPEDRRAELRPYLTPFLVQLWQRERRAGGCRSGNVCTLKPEVHVLIAYARENGILVSPEYDTPKYRAELAQWFEPLGLESVWTEVAFDNLTSVIAGLTARQKDRPIVIFNLCDGTETDGYPGPSVIDALSREKLPFSGASAEFYRISTSKLASKRLFEASGVPTASMMQIIDIERDVYRAVRKIGTPFIIKPDISAGSYGIQIDSVCNDAISAIRKIKALRDDPYIENCDIFVESFISGREFTVFAVEDESQPRGLRILTPCERVFDARLPEQERFIIYERHWDLPEDKRSLPEGVQYCIHEPVEGSLRAQLEQLVREAVRAVSGSGYARCDVRQDAKTGKLYVLEVNSQCDMSSDPISEIGSILRFSGMTMPDLLEIVLNHALAR